MTWTPPKCTACGKAHHEVRKLVALPKNINVCDECINLCVEIVHEGLENSGLVTITAVELADLRQKAREGEMARIWINGVRRAVSRADEELTRHAEAREQPVPGSAS